MGAYVGSGAGAAATVRAFAAFGWGGGSGTRDCVSLATGFTGPFSVGSGIRCTTVTATDPIPPP